MPSSKLASDGVRGGFVLTRYCSQCGAESLPGSFCPGCGAWVEQDATAVDPRVAGFGIRAVARILDNVVALAVGIVAANVAVVVLAARGTPGTPAEWLQAASGLSSSGVAASILGSFLYSAIAEYLAGASIGKFCCGLRVLSEDFERVSLLGALVRSFALLIDGALFGLVAYLAMDRSLLRQRLGDRWGDTLVVHRKAMPQLEQRLGQIAFGNGVGLAVFTLLCAYSVVVRASAAAGIFI